MNQPMAIHHVVDLVTLGADQIHRDRRELKRGTAIEEMDLVVFFKNKNMNMNLNAMLKRLARFVLKNKANICSYK